MDSELTFFFRATGHRFINASRKTAQLFLAEVSGQRVRHSRARLCRLVNVPDCPLAETLQVLINEGSRTYAKERWRATNLMAMTADESEEE